MSAIRLGTGGQMRSVVVLLLALMMAPLAVACAEEDVPAGEDRRPSLRAELGPPDAFVLRVEEVDGNAARFESWSYHEAATQIDMVDGEVVWTVELEPLPDGTIYPHWYDPADFTLLATPDEVRSRLPDVTLEAVPLDDEAVPGAVFLAGDQLLLGFIDDRLVYVETFPLAPDEGAP